MLGWTVSFLTQLFIRTNHTDPPELTPIGSVARTQRWEQRARLVGTIPTEIQHLSRLQELILQDHYVEGALPARHDTLQVLSVVSLGRGLTGSIPTDMADRFPALRVLDLRHNDLEGSIPSTLMALTALQHLQLGGNANMTGVVPTEMDQLVSLGKSVHCLLCSC